MYGHTDGGTEGQRDTQPENIIPPASISGEGIKTIILPTQICTIHYRIDSAWYISRIITIKYSRILESVVYKFWQNAI